MKNLPVMTILAAACLWSCAIAAHANDSPNENAIKSVYDFEMKDIQGANVPLSG